MMKIDKYIAGLLIAAAVSGCVRDKSERCLENGGSVLIQVQIPELEKTRTVAIDPADDNEFRIEHLDVLVFNAATGIFMYATEPTEEITTHPDYPILRTYVLPLNRSKGGVRQQLVVLANLRNEVGAALAAKVPDSENPTISKSEFFGNLTFDLCDWAQGIPLVSGYEIPMWGESEKGVVVTDLTTGGSFGTINLIRGVARIEVAIEANSPYTEAYGLDNFEMTSVLVRNVPDKGMAVPNGNAAYSGGVVFSPSIPDDATIIRNVDYLGDGDPNSSYSGSPYLHRGPYYVTEADNKNAPNDRRTHVVVGGYYTRTGEPPNTTEKSYYRIDFYDRDSGIAEIKPLDILRGCRYMINITGVDGPGFPTIDEAENSVTTKIHAEVVKWNHRNIEVHFVGKEYTLNVSQADFTLNGMPYYPEGDMRNKVIVSTDYSEGWSVVSVVDVTTGSETVNDWLTVSPMAGEANADKIVTLNVSPNPMWFCRYGRVYINAGKWTYVINVKQKVQDPQ